MSESSHIVPNADVGLGSATQNTTDPSNCDSGTASTERNTMYAQSMRLEPNYMCGGTHGTVLGIDDVKRLEQRELYRLAADNRLLVLRPSLEHRLDHSPSSIYPNRFRQTCDNICQEGNMLNDFGLKDTSIFMNRGAKDCDISENGGSNSNLISFFSDSSNKIAGKDSVPIDECVYDMDYGGAGSNIPLLPPRFGDTSESVLSHFLTEKVIVIEPHCEFRQLGKAHGKAKKDILLAMIDSSEIALIKQQNIFRAIYTLITRSICPLQFEGSHWYDIGANSVDPLKMVNSFAVDLDKRMTNGVQRALLYVLALYVTDEKMMKLIREMRIHVLHISFRLTKLLVLRNWNVLYRDDLQSFADAHTKYRELLQKCGFYYIHLWKRQLSKGKLCLPKEISVATDRIMSEIKSFLKDRGKNVYIHV